MTINPKSDLTKLKFYSSALDNMATQFSLFLYNSSQKIEANMIDNWNAAQG